MGAPTQMKTVVYSGKIYNYQKNRFKQLEMTGISTIGPYKGPTQQTHRELDYILKPINMESQSLTWAINREIDIIIGGDNAGILVQDHPTMNNIRKPTNLRFYTSPVFNLPLEFGELSRQWSENISIGKQFVIPETKPPDKLTENKMSSTITKDTNSIECLKTPEKKNKPEKKCKK